MSWWSTTCAWWPTSPRRGEAEGKKSRKASGDAALRDLIWDKAKGKTLWQFEGQAVFRDYNRRILLQYTVII